MLNQSTPILKRTKRAYLTYLERLVRVHNKKYLDNSESLEVDTEIKDTVEMIRLITVKLRCRESE